MHAALIDYIKYVAYFTVSGACRMLKYHNESLGVSCACKYVNCIIGCHHICHLGLVTPVITTVYYWLWQKELLVLHVLHI